MPLKNSVLSLTRNSHVKYLDRLNARIDVVREGLISNPLNVDLEKTIREIMDEVTHLIFNKTWISPLPISNWVVARNFILSLNDVAASARRVNRSLYFSAQRSVFILLGYIFNHPQYSELCDIWLSADNKYNFNAIQTMYSEAERQNYSPCLFGDLYAEGEWVSNIMGSLNLSIRNHSPNPKGLNSALDLWENFVSYSAKTNPNRIPKLFENIINATTSILYGYLDTPLMLPETEAFQAWKKMYAEIKPHKISTLQEYEAAFKVLHGEKVEGKWAVFNGAFESNSNFFAGTLPKIEEVWFECIQSSVFDSIAFMYGVCAFNGLWKELRDCWYLSQPEDANATFSNHKLFCRDPQEFSLWINNHILPMDRTIHDRHDLKIHLASACTVLIGDMLNNDVKPSFIFNSIANAEELEQFINLLQGKSNLINQEQVRAAFDWDFIKANKIKCKVDDFLNSELVICKHFITDNLKKCIPVISIKNDNINLNKGDREQVYEAWDQTNQVFWRYFSRIPAVKVRFTRNILPNKISRPFIAGKSYYLSEKSGKRISGHNFDGIYVADLLNYKIAQRLESAAKTPLPKVKKGCSVFIAENDWSEEGLNHLSAKYGINLNFQNTLKSQGEKSFIVEQDAAELVLTEWPIIPWHKENYPVIVYGFTEFSEYTTGVSSLYYEIKILNPAGFHLL